MTSADKRLEELEKWLEGRPEVIQDIARKYPPWQTYVHKGHPDTATYTVYSISEDGTVTCNKTDFLGFQIQVFGMNPDDLMPLKEGGEELSEEVENDTDI